MMMMALLWVGMLDQDWLPGRRISECVCVLQHGFEILVISQSLSLQSWCGGDGSVEREWTVLWTMYALAAGVYGEFLYLFAVHLGSLDQRGAVPHVQPYVGTNDNRLVLLITYAYLGSLCLCLGACLGDCCEAVGLAAMFRLGVTSRSLPWH